MQSAHFNYLNQKGTSLFFPVLVGPSKENHLGNLFFCLSKYVIQCFSLLTQIKNAEIQGKLDGDYKELVKAASEFAQIAGSKDEKKEEFTVYNPNYVTNHDKEKLLKVILDDFKAENPKAKTMTYQQVKAVLETRYSIETRTIGNFFRRQLPDYETTGGNKNKKIVLKRVI